MKGLLACILCVLIAGVVLATVRPLDPEPEPVGEFQGTIIRPGAMTLVEGEAKHLLELFNDGTLDAIQCRFPFEVPELQAVDDDAEDCMKALKALCKANGSTLSSMNFDKKTRRCDGDCDNGSLVFATTIHE